MYDVPLISTPDWDWLLLFFVQHSAAVITDLLVPPSNLPNRAAAANAVGISSPVRDQIAATVSAASLTAKLAEEMQARSSGRDSRRTRRTERRAAAAAAGGRGRQQAKEIDVDADEEDTQARGVQNPAQLIRDLADMQLISLHGPR
jgi:hypothetical protein